MYRLNVRFSLITLALCTVFVYAADAAPSIRVLGSNSASTKNSGTTKVSAVSNGNNIKAAKLGSTIGAKKSASAKMIQPVPRVVSPATKATSERVDTATTTEQNTDIQKGNIRFPGIMTKANIQPVSKPATEVQNSVAKTNADIQNITNRLEAAETALSTKADKTELGSYYTKDEVETIRDNYYTKGQVNDKLDEIGATVSTENINLLTTKIDTASEHLDQIDQQIQEILTSDGAVYDNTSQQKVDISLVHVFNEDLVLGNGEQQ